MEESEVLSKLLPCGCSYIVVRGSKQLHAPCSIHLEELENVEIL